MFTVGDRIENIHTKERRTVVKVEEVHDRTVCQLDNGVRFNSDYKHHWRRQA